MQISQELKELRREHNLTQEKAAETTNISVEAWRSWEQERHTPPADKMDRIRRILGSGDGRSQMTHTLETTQKNLHLYEDIVAGAGSGIEPINEWKFTTFDLPLEILRSLVGTRPIPDEIGIVQIEGESMYPEVQSGDWVMFTPTDVIADGSAYLVRLEDALLLKVLQRKPGRRLRIHSLNASIEDDYIRKTSAGEWVTDDHRELVSDFEVIGKFLNVIQPKDLYAASQRVHDILGAYQTLTQNDIS